MTIKLSWRRSKQAFFLIFISISPLLYSIEDGTSKGSSPYSLQSDDDLVNWMDVINNESLLKKDSKNSRKSQTVINPLRGIIPEVKVASCKQNMAPLLQGVCAYFKSDDFNDPHKQVRSFHRLLLVGPPGSGKSTMAEVIAQEYGFEPIIRNASQFRRDYRGQTANSIRDLFTHLASKKNKVLLVLNEIHKLVEGHANKHMDHAENAEALWGALDDIEKNYPHVVVIGTANHIEQLPPELKSRFRVQYVYVPLIEKSEWLSGLHAAFSQDSSIVFEDSEINIAHHDRVEVDNHLNTAEKEVDLDMQGLTVEGLSYRDQELVRDAAKIFAYRDRQCTVGKLIVRKKHLLQAYEQLRDKNKVLDFYAHHETDEERYERYHQENKIQGIVHHMQGIRANLMTQSHQKPQKNAGINIGGGAGTSKPGMSGGLQGGIASPSGISRETARRIEQKVFTDEQKRIYQEATGQDISSDRGFDDSEMSQGSEKDFTRNSCLIVIGAIIGGVAVKVFS